MHYSSFTTNKLKNCIFFGKQSHAQTTLFMTYFVRIFHQLIQVLTALTFILMSACKGENFTYSNFHCNLYIDNSTHHDPTLASAMNAMSPGVFCTIKYLPNRNAYFFTSNQGQSSTNNFDAKDTERGNSSRIGMNNGLIVGYANLSNDGSGYHFYAFDAQCPVCFDYNAIPMRSYPLSINGSGIATCANCKRQFNLNTGGNCINNTGQMTTYRATTAGPFGILFVN